MMIIKKNILALCITGLCITLNSCSTITKKLDNTLITESIIEMSNQENCSWCGTSEAQENVSWKTIIPPKGEPGRKPIIFGTINLPAGETPAKDIIVYINHTNTEGVYPKKEKTSKCSV